MEHSIHYTNNINILKYLYDRQVISYNSNDNNNIDKINNLFYDFMRYHFPKKDWEDTFEWFTSINGRFENSSQFKFIVPKFKKKIQPNITTLINILEYISSTNKIKNFEPIKNYINNYYNINEIDEEGNTYLHYIFYYRGLIEEYLPLSNNCIFNNINFDINKTNNNGNTPCHEFLIRCIDIYNTNNIKYNPKSISEDNLYIKRFIIPNQYDTYLNYFRKKKINMYNFIYNKDTLKIKNNDGYTPVNLVINCVTKLIENINRIHFLFGNSSSCKCLKFSYENKDTYAQCYWNIKHHNMYLICRKLFKDFEYDDNDLHLKMIECLNKNNIIYTTEFDNYHSRDYTCADNYI